MVGEGQAVIMTAMAAGKAVSVPHGTYLRLKIKNFRSRRPPLPQQLKRKRADSATAVPRKMSAYICFCDDRRSKLDRTEFPSSRDVTAQLGKMWSAMSLEEKNVWRELLAYALGVRNAIG